MKWILLSIAAAIAFIAAIDIALSSGHPKFYGWAALIPVLATFGMAWPLSWKGGWIKRMGGYFAASGFYILGWCLFLVLVSC